VDEGFRQNFLSKSQDYNKFFIKDNNESGKYFFDLIGFGQEKLLARGVRNIYNESIDTYKNPERWPSHRRMMGQSSVKNNDQAPQQRFLSAICLK
jgi:copper oxidase (laccase) domain-containing protein